VEVQSLAADLEGMAASFQDLATAKAAAEARETALTQEVQGLTDRQAQLRRDHLTDLQVSHETAEGLESQVEDQLRTLQTLQHDLEVSHGRVAELEAERREAEAIRAQRDDLQRRVTEFETRWANVARLISWSQDPPSAQPRAEEAQEETPPPKRMRRSEDDGDPPTTPAEHSIPSPGVPPSTPSLTPQLAPSPPPSTLPPIPRFVIAVSGFQKKTDPAVHEYSYDQRKQAERKIRHLGAEVAHSKGEDLDSAVTHVVTVPGSRTIRCLAAFLTGRWVVSARWVHDSHAAGHWLDETPYRYQGNATNNLIRDKRVYLSDQFNLQSTRIRDRSAHTRCLVVTHGCGHLVEDVEGADVVFVTCREDRRVFAPRTTYTWDQFVDAIPPVPAPVAPIDPLSSASSSLSL